ncbi:MAG: hypothetical protein Fur0025_47270 [Oscillatoriaceae cyanobacterium]
MYDTETEVAGIWGSTPVVGAILLGRRYAIGSDTLRDRLLPQKRVHRNRVSFSLSQLTVISITETRFLFRGKEAIGFGKLGAIGI